MIVQCGHCGHTSHARRDEHNKPDNYSSSLVIAENSSQLTLCLSPTNGYHWLLLFLAGSHLLVLIQDQFQPYFLSSFDELWSQFNGSIVVFVKNLSTIGQMSPVSSLINANVNVKHAATAFQVLLRVIRAQVLVDGVINQDDNVTVRSCVNTIDQFEEQHITN